MITLPPPLDNEYMAFTFAPAFNAGATLKSMALHLLMMHSEVSSNAD